jgi:hypothetical protein
MYAIISSAKMVGTVISMNSGSEWYSESKGWTPASDEATIYESREEAEAVIKAESLGRSAAAFEMLDEDEDISVAGCIIQHDASGVGHAWKTIAGDDIPADIVEEIEGEIFDGGKESCSDFIGSNGEHYRW